MSAMAYQITSLTIVYSTVYSSRNSKNTPKLRVTGLCEGNSPVTGEFPAQMASSAKNVPSGTDRIQVGPMLAPWTLLSGYIINSWKIGANKTNLSSNILWFRNLLQNSHIRPVDQPWNHGDHYYWHPVQNLFRMNGILFLHLSTSIGCFCPQTFFSISPWGMLRWTSFITNLHTDLKIIRGIPGLATDSPCGIWGRGWATYLLNGDPLLGLCV